MKNLPGTYSALILAGGLSERMGFPKPWLMYDADTTYLERIVNLYSISGIHEICIVLNENSCREPWLGKLNQVSGSSRIILNRYPGKGRLHSVSLGLQEISSDKILIHNVDNPFVEPDVISTLMRHAGNENVSIPEFEGKHGHPVVIDVEVKNEIIQSHESYPSLRAVLANFEKKYVVVSSSSILVNINKPSDYQAAYEYL